MIVKKMGSKEVIKYFKRQTLSQQQIDTLQVLLASQVAQERQWPWLSRTHLAWVASFVVVCFSLLLFFGNNNVLEDVSREVVYNHIKEMPLEVSSMPLDSAQAYFSKLDFSLVESEFFAQRRFSFLGGRYCSIKSEIAAQLRYRKQGQIVTLYQAAYDKKIFGDVPSLSKDESPYVNYVRGYRVEVWRENGVLLACVEKA